MLLAKRYWNGADVQRRQGQSSNHYQISIYDRVKEEIIYFENGKNVLRLEDKILSQSGREIRS